MAKIIRKPDFAGGGITDAERALMDKHAKMWIDRIMRTEPIEQDKIIPAIRSLYEVSGLKQPRVVIVPSPFVMALAGGFSAAIWWLRKNKQPATYDATDAATYDATYAATRAATDAATRAATRAADVDNDVVRLMLNCARQFRSMYQGGNMWGQWDCYLTAARDILGLRLPAHEKYAVWEQCAIHGGFRFMHDEFCMVSDFPVHIKVDERNLPHCEDGPSHLWRDGWSIHHWHGIHIPAEWIEGKPPTAAEAITWDNMEQRRAACEILGWVNILQELNARTIDAHKNPMVGELVEVDLPDVGIERFLRVMCGTNRLFALPVPPDMDTAENAQRWLNFIPDDVPFVPAIRT